MYGGVHRIVDMPQAYRTEFEVSYLSNGTLFSSLSLVAIGVVAAIVGFKLWRERARGPAVFIYLFSCVWLVASVSFVYVNLRDGRAYKAAMLEGRSEVVEGVVEVLYRQPEGGHAPGDRIRVGGREFQYSYFTSTLAYNRTIAHGGVLVQGARVRVHDLDGAILKVEVAP